MIWLVLACLLPGIIGAAMFFLHQYREARAQQENDTTQTARALVQAVDSHLLRAQSIAQVLSTADSIATHDFARFHRQARETIKLAGMGSNVVLRDKTGQQIVNTAVEFGQPLPRQTGLSQAADVFKTGKPVVSNLFIGLPLKRPIMSVDVPVVLDGKVKYALAIGILPESFHTILKAQNLPSGLVTAIFDSAGTIVGRTHSSEKYIGQKVVDEFFRATRKSAEGAVEVNIKEGIPVLSVYSISPRTHWGVVIGIPRSSLHKTLAAPLAMLAGGMIFLFGAGLALAWFMSRRIAHSITALTGPAMALGSGGSAEVPHVHVKEAAEVGLAISRADDLLKERSAMLHVSETELAKAHRLARFGTWHWDLESGAIETSESVRHIFGRQVPSFPEQKGSLLTVESWERVHAASQEMQRTGNSYDLELQVNHGDGHAIWINAKGEAVRNEKGEVIALRGTIQDITALKENEQALRASERDARQAARQAQAERLRLDAVLDATPVGIVVADANGALLMANAANKILWGENQPPTESIHAYRAWKGWWADGSKRHGRRLEPHEWPMARALSGQEHPRDIIEIEPFDAPSAHRIVLISGAPIKSSEGRILGGVIAQMDITDRMNAEEALRQADRRKDEFLAMLAHELRNPLAPISAAADLLMLAPMDAARVKQISAIVARQAKHMTGLIDDLLDVSRVTRGLVMLEKQRLDVKRTVTDAVEQIMPLVEARRHRLAVHTPAEPVFVLGDKKRLVQIIGNLLNNAAKFTPEGGSLALSVEADREEVRINVADNGIGMAPELTNRAFDLFTQEARTPDRSQGGLGIGLALVKSLVELHEGSVAAYSEGAGKGSRFTVRLPRLNGQHAAPEAEEQRASMTKAPAGALKIMVVDDNMDAAQTLAMFVEALGHRVFVEYASAKALDQAKTELPDVCLLDVGLPEIDGNELARRLRTQPETAGAVLIAVTGYGQEHDRKDTQAAGFDHHLVKPFDKEKLAAILADINKVRSLYK